MLCSVVEWYWYMAAGSAINSIPKCKMAACSAVGRPRLCPNITKIFGIVDVDFFFGIYVELVDVHYNHLMHNFNFRIIQKFSRGRLRNYYTPYFCRRRRLCSIKHTNASNGNS